MKPTGKKGGASELIRIQGEKRLFVMFDTSNHSEFAFKIALKRKGALWIPRSTGAYTQRLQH